LTKFNEEKIIEQEGCKIVMNPFKSRCTPKWSMPFHSCTKIYVAFYNFCPGGLLASLTEGVGNASDLLPGDSGYNLSLDIDRLNFHGLSRPLQATAKMMS
jgi:hypothetical protein